MSSKYSISILHLCREQKLVSLPTVFHLKLRPVATLGMPYILRCGGLSSPNVLSDRPLTSLTKQGHCMPETSVKIRTSVCRLNIQVHVYGN